MKKYIRIILGLVAIIMLLNAEVTTRQGVNFRTTEIKKPLYLKILDFFDRHYNYVHLVKNITSGTQDKEEKVIKILHWVHGNIRQTPPGFPIVDDHPLNIVIRGYGVEDQYEDIFTILANYAGAEAFLKDFKNSDGKSYIIAFVRIDGLWYPMSAYAGVYPVKDGKAASIKDIQNDHKLLDVFSKNVPCFETESFVKDVGRMSFRADSMRSKGQSPLGRLFYFFKRGL